MQPDQVIIYCGMHGLYERANHNGYTNDPRKAGIYERSKVQDLVESPYSDRKNELLPVPHDHEKLIAERIASLTAERDAAKAEAAAEERRHDQTMRDRDEHEERLNQIFSALGMDELESAWSSANDPAAIATEKAEQLRTDLDLARAEASRAVEALRRWLKHAERDGLEVYKLSAETRSICSSAQPALDWLAQQRREAAAEELEMLRDHIQEYIGPDDARDEIRRICANRIADLRAGKGVQDAE
jgi:hypothetical protein